MAISAKPMASDSKHEGILAREHIRFKATNGIMIQIIEKDGRESDAVPEVQLSIPIIRDEEARQQLWKLLDKSCGDLAGMAMEKVYEFQTLAILQKALRDSQNG